MKNFLKLCVKLQSVVLEDSLKNWEKWHDTWEIDVKRQRTRESILETSLDDGKTWDQKCHSLLKTISLRVPTLSFTDDSVVGWVIGLLWIGAVAQFEHAFENYAIEEKCAAT